MAGKVDPDTGLQDAQQRFADEYLIDFNATEAYKRAGYRARGKAAQAAACRLLANDKVQAYLATKKTAMLKRSEFDADAALKRLAYMALGDRRGMVRDDGTFKDIHELTEEEAGLIAGFELVEMFAGTGEERKSIGFTKKLRLVNPLDAVKALGTHFGMFVQQHKHEHKVEGLSGILQEIDGADTGPGRSQSRRD